MEELQIFNNQNLGDNELSSKRSQKHTEKTEIVCKFFVVGIIICVLCFSIISIIVLNHKIHQLQRELSKRDETNLQQSDNSHNTDNNIESLREEVRNMSILLQTSSKRDVGSIRDEVMNLGWLLDDFKESQNNQQALGFSAQDFKFDKTTLHRNIYISKDGRTINNKNVTEEMDKGNGSFRNYLGVRGTKQFSKYDIIYYEVIVNYELLKNMSKTWLAFEFGFSTIGTTDDYHYVGFQIRSWSIHCANNMSTNMMTLSYQVSKSVRQDIKSLSPNTANTTFSGTFSFFVNGPKKEITFYHRHENDLEKLHTFENVDFLLPLFPTFGVYSRNYLSVRLNLKTRKFINTIPILIKELI